MAIPQSDRRIMVTDQVDGPVSRRIDLCVSWPNNAGQPQEPVRLTIWKFQKEPQP